MTRIAALLVVVVLLQTAAADEKADLARMQGMWQVTKAVRNGVEVPFDVRDALRVTVVERSLTIRSADNVPTVVLADLTLDPSKSPNQISLQLRRKLPAMPGIYQIDGATLKLCWANEGGPRPDGFSSPAKSHVTLFELQKITK